MDNLEAILKDLKEIKSEVRTIRLGLYGDKVNKIPGLIDRQESNEQKFKEVDKRLDSVEQRQNKIFVYASMIATGAGIAWNFIKDLFKN